MAPLVFLLPLGYLHEWIFDLSRKYGAHDGEIDERESQSKEMGISGLGKQGA